MSEPHVPADGFGVLDGGAGVDRRSGADVDPESGEEFRALPAHYERCFGCGREHPTGLHLQMVGAGRVVKGYFDVTEHHQGAPGLAHGGVIASAMDEGMGFLVWLLVTPAVTAHLEVDFRRPVPIGKRLRLEGRVERLDGRKVSTRMTGHIDGELVVEAKALFLSVGFEHFQPHAERVGLLSVEPHTYNP